MELESNMKLKSDSRIRLRYGLRVRLSKIRLIYGIAVGLQTQTHIWSPSEILESDLDMETTSNSTQYGIRVELLSRSQSWTPKTDFDRELE